VFGNNAKDTGVDADVWRFYLLSRRPEGGDSEFKWQEFVDINNNDLLKNLGNLNQRVIKFCHSKMAGVVPDYGKYSDELLQDHVKEVNACLKSYLAHLEAIKLRAGLASILQISALGNKLLQDNKLDNRLFSEDPVRCAAVIGLALNQLHLLANILSPYMPGIAESIFQQLGVSPRAEIPDVWDVNAIKPGHTIGTPKLLFTAIPSSRVEEWREAYGGEEVRRQKALDAEKAAAKRAAKDMKKLKKAGAAAAAIRAEESQGGEATKNNPKVNDAAVEEVADSLGKVDVRTRTAAESV
jgi:methionyl-tRNA synthetase